MKGVVLLLILILGLSHQEIFLSDGKEEERDQLQIEYLTLNDPEENTILSYPKDISSDKKYGVIIWAPGYGSKAGDYSGILDRRYAQQRGENIAYGQHGESEPLPEGRFKEHPHRGSERPRQVR